MFVLEHINEKNEKLYLNIRFLILARIVTGYIIITVICYSPLKKRALPQIQHISEPFQKPNFRQSFIVIIYVCIDQLPMIPIKIQHRWGYSLIL